jgi:hypothetical protein
MHGTAHFYRVRIIRSLETGVATVAEMDGILSSDGVTGENVQSWFEQAHRQVRSRMEDAICRRLHHDESIVFDTITRLD